MIKDLMRTINGRIIITLAWVVYLFCAIVVPFFIGPWFTHDGNDVGPGFIAFSILGFGPWFCIGAYFGTKAWWQWVRRG